MSTWFIFKKEIAQLILVAHAAHGVSVKFFQLSMCSFVHIVLFHTQCVILHKHCVILHTLCTCVTRIYALLSVKFSGLKMCECKKWQIPGMGNCILSWQKWVLIKFQKCYYLTEWQWVIVSFWRWSWHFYSRVSIFPTSQYVAVHLFSNILCLKGNFGAQYASKETFSNMYA